MFPNLKAKISPFNFEKINSFIYFLIKRHFYEVCFQKNLIFVFFYNIFYFF